MLTISVSARTLFISTISWTLIESGSAYLFTSTQHVKLYWTSFAIASDAFGMVFWRKNNDGSTSFLATSSFFSPVLSNATLCNVIWIDSHMMQVFLLNSDVDERNLFLFVWGVLQINFLSEVLEISAVWFKTLFETFFLSNLFYFCFCQFYL